MKKASLLFAIFVVLFIAGCGGPQTVTNEEFGVSVEIPGGWKTMYDPGYVSDTVTIEPSLTILGDDLSVAVVEYVTESTASSLAMLQEAMTSQGYTEVTSMESDTLFGGVFAKEGEDSLIYYVSNSADKTVRCVNGGYYEEKYAEKVAQVCASLK